MTRVAIVGPAELADYKAHVHAVDCAELARRYKGIEPWVIDVDDRADLVLAVWGDIGSDTLDTDQQIVAGYRDECRFFPCVALADR